MIIDDRRGVKNEGYGEITNLIVLREYIGIHVDLGYYIKLSYEELQQIEEVLLKETGIER